MDKITKDSTFFYNIIEEYKRTTSFNSSRIRQDLTEEDSTSKDYRGRELYELLQNAEDENSDSVKITLQKEAHVISIENSGKECTPFTEDGFCSIMMTNMSPKRASGKSYIGQKGLGFRSLLNWAEKIVICSSGVRCSFSYEIAERNWKSIASSIGDTLKKEHEDFAASQFGRSCPIPMLSVPEVEADKTSGQYTTKIEIAYKESSYESIKEQLDSLSGKVLLFLSNIKSIVIQEDGEGIREIKREDDSLGCITTYDLQHQKGQKWIVFEKKGDIGKNKKFEIKIAYDSMTQERGNFVYSFFPTRVRLDLPCVVHATFDLNSSRNDLISPSKENDELQKEIGQLLLDSAEKLATASKTCDWQFFKMVNFKNEYDQERFNIVNSILSSTRESKSIFPTIEGSYRSLKNTCHYSEDLAVFLSQNHEQYPNILCNHLLPGYSDLGINSNFYDDNLGKSINDLSHLIQPDSLEIRASMIASLVSVSKCLPMNILIDENGDIIDGEAFINVGETLPNLPAELNIKYVHSKLVEKLITVLNVTENNKGRGVRSRLSSNKCANVSDLDINAVKKRICSYTQKEMKPAVFEQLLYSLFAKFYLSGDKSSNNSLEGIFNETEFKVLNGCGESVAPSMTVLNPDPSYDSKWALLKDANGWKTFFEQCYGKEIDEELITDFFIKKVGISERIPLSYVPIDYKADDYIWNATSCQNNTKQTRFYYSDHIEYYKGGNYNHYFVPDIEFLKYLKGRNKSMFDIVSLILSEPRAKRSLFQEEISYFYKALKEDYPDFSYSSYILRKSELFSPIRKYIVSEKIFLGMDEELENDLNKIAGNDLALKVLLSLGAHHKLSELSVEELYDSLQLFTERGVKPSVKVYKAIKDAIIVKENFQSHPCVKEFYSNGKVFARKGDGDVEIQPVSNVYYWDNDQLPQSILKSKYKLLLPNREGEENVKKVFGVKLAKEINLTIEDNIQNLTLECLLQNHLSNRRRLLMAYRLCHSREISDDKFRRTIAKDLKDIDIRVYSNCKFSYDGCAMSMKEGDMVATTNSEKKQIFHICSSHPTIDSALREPSFCSNIAEAICISLKVFGHDMFNSFLNVLKNSDEENRYYSAREIPDELWPEVDKAMGVSDYEQSFWEKVGEIKDVCIDKEKLTLDWMSKVTYLSGLFPHIQLPEEPKDFSDFTSSEKYHTLLSMNMKDAHILGGDGLYKYYENKLLNEIDSYKYSYAEYVFSKFDPKSLPPQEFKRKTEEFERGLWLEPLIKDIQWGIYNDSQLDDFFVKHLYDVFGRISLDSSSKWCPEKRPEYIAILLKYKCEDSIVDQNDLVLTFFPGYESQFEAILKEKLNVESNKLEQTSSIDDTVREISVVYGLNQSSENPSDEKLPNPSKERTHGGSYSPDTIKVKAGKKAEKIVFDSLCASGKYANVIPCSRNLDPNYGNDKLHYDIKYRPVDDCGKEGEERFLEVKSMSGNTIYLSRGEKLFAESNAERYDLALVRDGQPYLLISPFVGNEIRPRLVPVPETFSVSLEIEPNYEE